MTWLPMRAFSPQVRPNLVLGRRTSPLPQGRQISTCQAPIVLSLVSPGLRVGNPPGEGKRCANPFRGEVSRVRTQGIMAMFEFDLQWVSVTRPGDGSGKLLVVK